MPFLAVEDILNAALRRAKYPTPIGNIYEGSRAARIALDLYGQTRDALFAETDWPFARQCVSLGTPIKTAPPGGYPSGRPWNPATDPPLPWIYEYTYPSNCILVRSVRPTPIFVPETLPWTNIFITAYDAQLGAKVVLTNLQSAQAIISARITDPSEWIDPNFEEALIDRLAALFAKNLLDVNEEQLSEREAEAAHNVAAMRKQ